MVIEVSGKGSKDTMAGECTARHFTQTIETPPTMIMRVPSDLSSTQLDIDVETFTGK
jgi:hypothetical protein